MQHEEKTCETCKFFKVADFKTGLGDCVRYPPRVFLIQKQNPITNQMGQGKHSEYPPVRRNLTACGEHRPNINGNGDAIDDIVDFNDA